MVVSECIFYSLYGYFTNKAEPLISAYQPPIAITISRMVAQVEKPNIEWPKALQR